MNVATARLWNAASGELMRTLTIGGGGPTLLAFSTDGKLLASQPLKERRRLLEIFVARYLAQNPTLQLSPATRQINMARSWLGMAGGKRDGIIAKRLDTSYQSGERTGMQKIKRLRTALRRWRFSLCLKRRGPGLTSVGPLR